MAKKAGFKSRFIFLLRSMALIKRRLDMLDKLNNQWRWLIFLLPGILFPLTTAFAAGGISTDGTVGPARTLNGANVDIPQNLGTTVGKNLFHSFSEFNVNNGQTVTFRENTQNTLDNVVSRVTGGSRSDINGTLRSTPGGHANLYLVNPSGLMFGPNARIDVAGTFHASTADEVRFQDGAKFSASQPSGSTLTAAAPASFGFLGTSAATNGLLKVDGAQLAAKPEQKLGMVGGNISVENDAKLSAPAGEVRLEAVGTGSLNIPIAQPSEAAHGELSLTKSIIDASGEGGGKVIIRGGDLRMDQNAIMGANTYGTQDGAEIDVRLTGDLDMSRGSAISAFILDPASGNAKGVAVSAKNIFISGQVSDNQGGVITSTASRNSGNAGDIDLKASDSISISGNSRLFSSTSGFAPFHGYVGNKGKAGNISLTSRNFEVAHGATIDSSNFFSEGGSGNIRIHASDSFHVYGQGQFIDISTGQTSMSPTRISSQTSGIGLAGKIYIQSPSLNITDYAQILGTTVSIGTGSDIVLKGKNIQIDSAEIKTGTLSMGNSGNIHVEADNLSIDGQTVLNGQPLYLKSGIYTETGDSTATKAQATGKAGNIDLRISDQLSLTRSGKISSSSFGTGSAGNITVNAGQLLIDGQGAQDLFQTGIFSSAAREWSGQGGGIAVDVQGDLNMIGGGSLIQAGTSGRGDSGNIWVTAKNLHIDGLNTITGIGTEAGNPVAEERHSTGRAGDIELRIANQLSLAQRGQINSSTFSTGDAGNITVNAGQLLIDGQGAQNLFQTGIFTDTAKTWSGQDGNINVKVQDRIDLQKGNISASTAGANIGTDKGSTINLTTKHLSLNKGGEISTISLGSRNAGSIFIHGVDDIGIDGVADDVSGVSISGELIRGNFSGIYINAQGSGNGGSLNLNANHLSISDGGVISAITVHGSPTNTPTKNTQGGSIDIHARTVNLTGGALISASTSGLGKAGSVKLTSTESVNISGRFDRNLHPSVTNPRVSEFSGISSSASYALDPAAKALGSGGSVIVNTPLLALDNQGEINVSTQGAGRAGSLEVITGKLFMDNNSRISAEASTGSGGETGNVRVTASDSIILSNQSKISIENAGFAITPQQTKEESLSVSAPNISLHDSQITTNSKQNTNARAIQVNFASQLFLDRESSVSTQANNGNGGDIAIQGGQLIQLINSGFTTSVLGQQSGDGGNISVDAENLVMETGLIQANTTAPNASGGNIKLDLKGLIPSGQTLILGGDQPVAWQPYEFGLNVIQAAAPNGVSGVIQSTAPQLNLSGVLANLGGPQFDTSVISQDYCALGTGSSLIRQGKGGLLPRSRDSVMY
jgi:filamentous hemagglutinin family protein